MERRLAPPLTEDLDQINDRRDRGPVLMIVSERICISDRDILHVRLPEM